MARMDVRLNSEPLNDVDCLKYLESQVSADGGCERDVVHGTNECKSWGALKSVLSNRGFGDKCEGSIERVIIQTALYRAEA